MAETEDLTTYELSGLEAGQAPLPNEPPAGIVLRPADLAVELPVMVELCRASFLLSPGGGTDEEGAGACAEVTGLLRHPGLAPPAALIALDGDLAVGLAVGRIEVPAAGEGARRAAVELLVVRPGYRRRGIGRALLGRLLAWLAARGVDAVVASTEDPIVAGILENHGFRANGGLDRPVEE